MAKFVLFALAPFAAIAGVVLAVWHLPAAAMVFVLKGSAISIGNGFAANVLAVTATAMWVALYSWPFLVIYGANQL